MRTKLFSAFLIIILLALLSNIVFEKLIIRDFNNFLQGTEEDHIYWVMASVEGSFTDGQWDRSLLTEALHWGLMLGFETYIEDTEGRRISSSTDVISSMNPNMLNRMESLLKLPAGTGEFIWYPLYIEGEEIGILHIRPLERRGLTLLKEEVFRKRGREFLVITFLIAGGGAVFLAVLLTFYLSTPVRRLTAAAERIAKGEFSVQGPTHQKKSFFNYKDEIDKLNETFNYMAEALKKEDDLRKHLTSNVAHELRTPLTVIRANLEAIEDGVISDSEAVIKNINLEIKILISLVEGIEDITRAEASFFKKGEVKEIQLKEFVGSAIEGMKNLIEEKGLYIKAEGSEIIVKTYPEKLHIILKNLLTNACKFTSSGGITVKWDKYKHNGVTGFLISIEDTGKGIDEEGCKKVFERFYKTADSEGRGLGLAIVRELTEVMGGKVELDSSPGRGSRFTLFF